MKTHSCLVALAVVGCAASPKPVEAPQSVPPPPCVETTAEIVHTCPKVVVAEYPNSVAFSSSEAIRNAMTCDFRITGFAGINERGQPEVEAVEEKNAMIVSFINLDSKEPMLKGTLGEEPLHKVKDDGDIMVLLERTAAGHVVVYSLSRSTKTAVFSKAYFMTGGLQGPVPLGMTTVGRCW